MDGVPQSEDSGYRVLARKYRPTRFDDLFGQDAMVRTLSNAFQSGRIAQAWMLTGVRGVGKTTTARILARALNYEIPGQIDQPTIDMPELGSHCQAIMEGRHVDVIEMDAASHTGIADIREITEAARYKPVSARYKVYIIDEVHMLSNQAFNGLLKTLEEPPAHVKFLFATTEIRKVPVTVLSRCQRFDLRRIDADLMAQFLQKIADAESVGIEQEALSMISRAAEGSARDALSLLDQAIAHGAETVAGETVRSMLGLADRARVIDLFESVMRGDIAAALDIVKQQFDIGAEPAIILTDLAEFTHLVTKFKISSEYEGGQAVTEMERTRGRMFAEALSMRVLSRAWQILLKGVTEVQTAPRALAAADMVLVRLCYAADLPTPDEVARQMRGTSAEISPGTSGAKLSGPSVTDGGTSPPVQTAHDPSGTVAPTQHSSSAPSIDAAPAPSGTSDAVGDHNDPGPSAYSASNVVSGAFGQVGAAALRKPDIDYSPEIAADPVPIVIPEEAEDAGTPAGPGEIAELAPHPEQEDLSQDPVVQAEDNASANVEVGEPGETANTETEAPSPPVSVGELPDQGHGNEEEVVTNVQFSSLREIADLLGKNRDLKLKFAVERQIRPVAMEQGKLEISVEPGAPADLAARLSKFLQDNTGLRWMVVVSRETGDQTLHEIDQLEQARVMSDTAAHPDVAAVLNAFPGAKIVDIRISPRDDESDEVVLDNPDLDEADADEIPDPDLDDYDFD